MLQLESTMSLLGDTVSAAAEDGSLSAAINAQAAEPLPGAVAVTGTTSVKLTEEVDAERANLNAALATVTQMLDVHALLRQRVRHALS